MAAGGLGSLLVRSGAVAAATVAAAERRRVVYGGTLDTALLELGATDERTLAAHLAEVTGWPAALASRLAGRDAEAASCLAPPEARRLGAVPIARRDDVLELAVHPEADRVALEDWAAAAGLRVKPAVLTEVRFRELLAEAYGEPVPPRFCALLGKLMGADRARQWLARRAPAPAVPPPPVDTGPRLRPPAVEPPGAPAPAPEPDIEIVEEEIAVEPAPAAPAEPGVEALLAALEAAEGTEARARALRALGARRAPEAVPALLECLGDRDDDVVAAAHAALVEITRQDFGTRRRRWTAWWRQAEGRHRIEWLLEALGHKDPELRLAASQELQALTGVYFGYHFDLPERDREEARRRWTDWWQTVGRPRLAGELK